MLCCNLCNDTTSICVYTFGAQDYSDLYVLERIFLGAVWLNLSASGREKNHKHVANYIIIIIIILYNNVILRYFRYAIRRADI